MANVTENENASIEEVKKEMFISAFIANDYIEHSAAQASEKIKILLNIQPQEYKLCNHYKNMRDNLHMNICERLYFH